ncbi:Detected protein of confused Function [Hibiscus syriacus]|uniref:Detected protein of confused Function n=1 Tax=Hibiscus syriacus TaxID=106335 RepID=A0A6A2XV69_HIBSY|nr:Detected protein of confused Function [Hibiscus syriacus]
MWDFVKKPTDDPSSYLHNHTCVSTVSGFSLLSDGSSSNLSNGSPPPPPLEDLKPHLSNGLFMDSTIRQKASSDSLFDELGLCRNLSKMFISNYQENFVSSFRDFSLESNGIQKRGACDELRRGFYDFVGVQSPVSTSVPLSVNGGRTMAFSGFFQQEYPQMYIGCPDTLVSPRRMNCSNGAMRSPGQKKECNLMMNDGLIYGQQNTNRNASVGNMLNQGFPLFGMMPRAHSNVGIPHEDNFIIQGDGSNFEINKRLDCSRGQNKGSLQEIGVSMRRDESSQLDNRSHFAAACGNAKLCNSFSLATKCNSLAEARGYIYLIAKDQHDCRFLQQLFDEGTPEDLEITFKEIIDHVVELMMNPFGNYLMQKLLEVCNEEQRMQILLMVTEEPGQLVRISLNTHGTRVVQKLIETLKTRQKISLVISALEPGFLSLINDLNGNHVVQRCLLYAFAVKITR